MDDGRIYHERQSKQLCGLHALNNLFQFKAFDKAKFDEINNELTVNSNSLNINRNPFGNYDINVLMAVLATRNYEAVWFDKRKKITDLKLHKIFGFILNVPVEIGLFGYFNPFNYLGERKHWLAIKKIGNLNYNLDSKLKKPRVIGNDKDVVDFLEEKKRITKVEIFLIVHKSIKEDESYFKLEALQL